MNEDEGRVRRRPASDGGTVRGEGKKLAKGIAKLRETMKFIHTLNGEAAEN